MLVPLAVADVMVSPVETVTRPETARTVADRLADANVGSLVVVEDGGPVGIVTESDVVRLLAAGRDVDAVTVDEVMSTELVTVTPATTLEEAASVLTEHDIRRLPVVEGDQLRGIVTTSDLSRYLPRVARSADRRRSGAKPQYLVRPDTAYEAEEWTFESRCVSEVGVTVGDVVEFSKPLDDEDVRAFAEASGDTNRLHLDEGYAGETRFGGRIVHGTLVAGLVSAALARLPGLTIYLSQDLSFHGPVRIGDRVTAVCEVLEELGDDRFLLTTDVYDEDEGDQIIEGEAVVLIDELPESAHLQVERAT